MKTEFELEMTFFNPTRIEKTGDMIKIVGKAPKEAVYIAIELQGKNAMFISGDDAELELFARNILKALNKNL